MPILAPQRLFTGESFIEDAIIHIENGRIQSVAREPAPSAMRVEGLMAAGFIDVQVNGGGGVLFNDAPTAAALATIAAAHSRFGVTGLMATLISDERSKIAVAIEAVEQAVAAGTPGILGLHLEGPWLSEPRRGVHPQQFLRRLDDADLALLTRPRSFPLMMTLAPEQAGLPAIETLAKAGVTISLGHTAASAEDIEAALSAGATGFTHLFNAMPPLEGRKPGAVGVALAHRATFAGLILDGVHVHPISARAAFAAKTARRLMLVSDAMATVGSSDPAMSLFGERIETRDGALRTASGTLAGAHLELSTAVRNAVTMLGATPEEALRMASLTPAEFLKQSNRGCLASGARADFVLLTDDLTLRETWIAGVRVH